MNESYTLRETDKEISGIKIIQRIGKRDDQDRWVRHDQRWSKTNGAYGTSTEQPMTRMKNRSRMGTESNKRMGTESNRGMGMESKVRMEMESKDRMERRGLGEITSKRMEWKSDKSTEMELGENGI